MIHRSILTDKFVRIPNDIAQKIHNPVAIGIVVYLLSLPLDWVVYKTHLYKHFKAGRKRIDDAFTELEELGYIVKVQKINQKGQFDGVEYICYDLPVLPDAQLPTNEKPIVGKPTVGKQATTKEHIIQNTHNTKNKEYKSAHTTWDSFVNNPIEITARLKEKYPNLDVEKAYEDVIWYCRTTGKKYKDYYLTALNWLRRNEKGQYNIKQPNYKRLN